MVHECVTHVPGLFCYPCARVIPCRGLTVHSSRRRSATRLNSGVRPHLSKRSSVGNTLPRLERSAYDAPKARHFAATVRPLKSNHGIQR